MTNNNNPAITLLRILDAVKVKLYLDPALAGSEAVTWSISEINKATILVREQLLKDRQ